MKARGPYGWPKATLPQSLGGTGGTDAVSAWAALAQLASQAEARAGSDAVKAITAARLADRLPVSSTALQRLQQSATSGLLEYTGPDGFKNLAGRNGGCEVWQRGTSVAASASTPAYTLDGWYLSNGANQAMTVSQQAGLTAGSRFCARVQRNNAQTGVTAIALEFPLDADEAAALSGNVVALSFTARSGANWSPSGGTLSVNLYDGTGSPAKRVSGAYTNDETKIASTAALTTTATRFTFVSSSALQASIRQASIYLQWTPTGTAGAADYFEIDDVQLEVSPVATAFERRPFALELLSCQRHLVALSADGLGLSFSATSLSDGTFKFGVPMRATPSLLSGATYTVSSGAAGTVRVNEVSARSLRFDNSAASWSASVVVQVTCFLGAEI